MSHRFGLKNFRVNKWVNIDWRGGYKKTDLFLPRSFRRDVSPLIKQTVRPYYLAKFGAYGCKQIASLYAANGSDILNRPDLMQHQVDSWYLQKAIHEMPRTKDIKIYRSHMISSANIDMLFDLYNKKDGQRVVFESCNYSFYSKFIEFSVDFGISNHLKTGRDLPDVMISIEGASAVDGLGVFACGTTKGEFAVEDAEYIYPLNYESNSNHECILLPERTNFTKVEESIFYEIVGLQANRKFGGFLYCAPHERLECTSLDLKITEYKEGDIILKLDDFGYSYKF
jgi:hypothetical protein